MEKYELVYPEYMENFKCIAEKCEDNCCIGWEICIDEGTLEKYGNVKGEFGKRLESSIKDSSFILKGERCAFLNDNNRCDIIETLGEDYLCHICDRHPRFIEQFGSCTEIGLGLSCESAAKLILSAKLDNYLISKRTDNEDEIYGYTENDDDESEIKNLTALRSKLFDFISKEESFSNCLKYIFSLCGEVSGSDKYAFFKDAAKFLSELEPVDENWKEFISLVSNAEKTDIVYDDLICRRLLFYFLYRYFMLSLFDGQLEEKLIFSAFMAAFCGCCIHLSKYGIIDEKYTPIKICAVISKEIEYSEDNLNILLDEIFDGILSPEKIGAII